MSNNKTFFIIGSLLFLLIGCMDQFDPRGDWQKFKEERKAAHSKPKVLNDDGSLPGAEGAGGEAKKVVANVESAKQKYSQFCASCHGANGAGDGVAGAALNPKPRNFADASWQDSVDDARIKLVIAKGGSAVDGVSPIMAGWEAVLDEAEQLGMVQVVRSFKK